MPNATNQDGPRLYLPGWHESDSGLVLPSSVAHPLHAVPGRTLPAALRPRPQPVALAGAPPTFMDQVAVYADEEAAGLSHSSLADVRSWASQVPFETGMLVLAQVAAKAWALRGDRDGQLRMARELYGEGPLLTRLSEFVAREGAKAQLFAEQHALMLQRILIESAAADSSLQALTGEQRAAIVRGLLGCTSVAHAAGEQEAMHARTAEDLLPLFMQNGAYNHKAQPLGEMARAQELFVRIADDPGRLPSQDKVCRVDGWMREDYRFSIEEQLTIGFALATMSGAWQDGWDAGSAAYIAPEHLEDLLVKLGMQDRAEALLDLVSADRATLRRQFAEEGSTISHVAWETRPLMRHPFLRCAGGGLILMSPRGMQSWLSDGFHYRLLESAQRRAELEPGRKRRTSQRYSAYAGQLLEVYALQLMRSVHPGQRPVGGGRVYGEQPYGRNGASMTSDVAVDLGLDLVLIEVCSSRPRASTLILADREEAIKDIKRTIIEKIAQLDRCITALRSKGRGRARIPAGEPEIDMRRVRRVWPVLVTGANITQSEPLWRYIDDVAGGRLCQPGVQPLTVLDLEDYEALCSLVEDGHALHQLLAVKTQPPFERLELAVCLREHPRAPKPVTDRPAYVEQVWQRTLDRIMASVDFTRGIQRAHTNGG